MGTREAVRPPRLTASIVAVLCAVIAIGVGLLTVVATQDGLRSPSALVNLADTDALAPTARATDPHFVLVTTQQHYDGVYYYAIARDPLLRGDEHTKIDQAAYRYGHPFHGWLARIVSLGNDDWIPDALLLLSLLGIGLAAWATSRLSVEFGRTPWGGLLIAASPGLLFAVSASTTECTGAALIALTLLAWLRGRIVIACFLLIALCLTKEQYVTVPLGLAIWEYVSYRRSRVVPDQLWTRVVALLSGPVVLSAWYVYVHAQLHAWPSSYEDGNLGAPFVGWIDTFHRAHDLAGAGFTEGQIGTTAAPLLIAIGVVCVAAAVKALRFRTPLDGIVLGLVAITACMGWRTLLYPHELVRNPAIVLLLAIGSLLIGPYVQTRAGSSGAEPAAEPSTT